jgi:Concanavalin A-like lectin/glucanases superfamily
MPLPWADLGPMGLDPCFRYPLDEAPGITTFRDIGGLVGKNPGYLGGTLTQGGGAAPGTKGSTYFGGAGYVNIGTAYTNRLWLLYGVTITAWIYRARNTGANDINPVMVIGPWSFVLQCGNHGSLPLSTANTMWGGFVNSNGNWDGVLDNAGVLPLNAWTHVAVTWDSVRIGLYRNGVDVASNSGIVGPGANTGGACIGVYPDGTSWRMNGFYLADVRYYPYRLYDGDMAALYNSYFTPVAPTWIKHREPGNLVLHMPLDRANVRDAIGAAVTGAGSAYGDGGAGSGPYPGVGSTYFNGSSSYLLARGYPAVDLSGSGGTGWSLAAWVYPTATRTSSTCIITKRYSSGPHIPYVLGFGTDVFGGAAGTVYCGGYNGSAWYGCRDTIAAPLNQWTHYAATYDGSWFRLYRNGVEISSSNVAVGLNANAEDIVIGHRWDGFAANGFPGYIADARIYYGAIGAADVKAIYDRAQAIKRDWVPLGQVY